MATANPVYTIPIAQRPPTPSGRLIYAIPFLIIFNTGCLMVNGSQFVFLLPLRILPFKWSRDLYQAGIRYTKGAFGCLMSASCYTLPH